MLGVALFASGAQHAVVVHLLATFWVAGALLTLRWAREHRGSSRSRLAMLAGVAGVAAAVVLLARFMIEAVISRNTTLAILGITAVVVGTLRLFGVFRDEPGDRPRPARSLALGASEIGIGVVWIAVDDVSRTVTVFGGLCALVVGTSMLVGALDIGGVRSEVYARDRVHCRCARVPRLRVGDHFGRPGQVHNITGPLVFASVGYLLGNPTGGR